VDLCVPPKALIRGYVLSRAVLGVMRCPAVWRKLTGLKDIFYSTEPFLIHLLERAGKPLLGFLPTDKD
jgi:hypothetical protein